MSQEMQTEREVAAAKQVIEDRETAKIQAHERMIARQVEEKKNYKGEFMADGLYHKDGKRFSEDGVEVQGMNDLVQHKSEINNKKHHKKHRHHSHKKSHSKNKETLAQKKTHDEEEDRANEVKIAQ